MQKLLSRPEKNIIILQELPLLGVDVAKKLRTAFERSENKGYFEIHTVPEPGKAKSDEVFTSSVPK
ncbi:MAG: hypothetical protein ABII22_00935 [Candidatus Micrarchaeota archaeon]